MSFSPDGRRLAYVRDNDLHVYDIGAGTEIRATHDGSETTLNGTLSWVYWEEVFGRRDIGYWWSPDSRALAYLQTDESPVEIAYFVDFAPQYPRLIRQRYPKAGTGIEASHRQMHQVRTRTASRNPVLRLLFVGLAFILYNLYIALRQHVAICLKNPLVPVAESWLTLRRLAHMLAHAVERLFDVADAVFRHSPFAFS